ncbi:hypothetical protein F4703DRAFT_1848485 [Phycomyces blakesleeanus]
MSSSRRPPVQPRPTRASLLRTAQDAAKKSGAPSEARKTAHVQHPPAEAIPTTVPDTPRPRTKIAKEAPPGSSEGLRSFLAQQRARVAAIKPVEKEKERPKRVMSGTQRYTSGADARRDEAFGMDPTRVNTKIQTAIAQAKQSGKLIISNRGLERIPEEVLTMYHVDPNKIVVDFTSSADAWYDSVELTKFMASDNQLVVLDERVGEEFGALTLLDLRNNQLQDLPHSLTRLKNLTHVQMPHNHLEYMPNVLLEMPQLRELDMSHNRLTELPPMDNLGRLEILLLGNNKLESLPESIGQLSHLRKLHVNDNQITELPAMEAWQRLEELLVFQNRLTILFSDYPLPSLTRVDARHNQLKELSESSLELPKLLEIFLSHNTLGNADLRMLTCAPQLQTLDLSWNDLDDLPPAVFEVQSLRRLDLGSNRFMSLPSRIGSLRNLQVLTWEGNPMRSIPKGTSATELIEILRSQLAAENGDLGKDDNEDEGVEGDYETNHGGSVAEGGRAKGPALPPQSQKSASAKTLDLANQNLDDFPQSFVSQIDFEPVNIQLHHNLLSSFPLNLSSFATTLVNLHLQYNEFSDFSLCLPDQIVLPSLKTLNLANNSIANLVTGNQVSFPNLEELNLNNNCLASLPETLPSAVPQLKILLLNGNRLDQISAKSFGRLTVLDLGNNNIGLLPPEIGLIDTITELTVYGNR